MANDNVFDFPTLGASSDTLKPGMKSAEVADLQRNLQKLGFVGIPANGVYDKTLATIVVLVQRAIMRPETGEVDSFTEASITRAVSEPGSMEALRISLAAREWSAGRGQALAAVPQSVQMIGDDKPFYLKGEFWVAAAGIAGLFFFVKKAMEPASAVQPILSGTTETDPDEGVEDAEEFFAGVGTKPKKKRKKRKAKQADEAEAEDLDGLEDGEVVDVQAEEVPAERAALPAKADDVPVEVVAAEPADKAAAVADAPAPRKRKRRKGPTPKRGPNGAFLPRGRSLADSLGEHKPKKRRKRKAKALAESASGDVDEILGEAGDPEMGD